MIAGLRPLITGAITVLLMAGLLLVPALINGFPLIYSDTGTYIRSAFEGYVPVDRPYWYGPFLRWTSIGGWTLWGTAAAQTILCACYLFGCTRQVLGTDRAPRIALLLTAVLTAGSSIGWYAGQLIPDIFTGIGSLAMYLLLRGTASRWIRPLHGLVIIAACWMHLSNLLILPLAGLSCLIIGGAHDAFRRRKVWSLAAVTAMAWFGLAFGNRLVDGRPYITRSSHAFLMGRMIDMGMLKPYLDEHCPEEHFGLCAYADSLPTNGQDLLWSDNSPMVKQGGWDATREEYGRIVHGSIIEPRYMLWHVQGSLTATASLLGTWEIGKGLRSGWYRTPGSPPYAMIQARFPQHMPSYLHCMQNGGRGELDMRVPDLIYAIVLGLSVIGAVLLLGRQRHQASGREGRVLLLFAIATVIIGAWVCATFSTVDSRYLGRDSWLLPFALLLAWIGRDARMPRRA
ncbi:MAG: hypothetical protein QM724_02755 [Flavobacteriales bacterium]